MTKAVKKRGPKDQRIAWVFLAPYILLFTLFIIVPVGIAIGLSFTNFNTIQRPHLVGFMNYINLLTRDAIFMQYAHADLLHEHAGQQHQFGGWTGRGGSVVADYVPAQSDFVYSVPEQGYEYHGSFRH